VTPAPAPPLQLLGGAVLIQGAPALLEVQHLLALGARERQRRDALPPSPRVRLLLALLAEAAAADEAASPARHRDVAGSAVSTDSVAEKVEGISTGEAAELLSLGRRQVQRLAPSIGARKVPGGALVYDRGAVSAYAAARRQETT